MSRKPKPASGAFASVVIVALVVVAVGSWRFRRFWQGVPSEDACSRLIKLQQRLAAEASGDNDTASRSDASSKDTSRCVSDLSARQVGCALETHHIDALERCLQ